MDFTLKLSVFSHYRELCFKDVSLIRGMRVPLGYEFLTCTILTMPISVKLPNGRHIISLCILRHFQDID